MFQPIGPNLRRSCIMAWNKQKPNKSFLNYVGFLHYFNSSSDMLLYVRNKFERKPWGGYTVIFTPFCNTDIGNATDGIEVSHSLKSLCMLSCSS